MVKNPPANAGDVRDMGLTPQLGRPPRGGNGNPCQYSCLENPMDRGTWQVRVHGVAKSWTPLRDKHAHCFFHMLLMEMQNHATAMENSMLIPQNI